MANNLVSSTESLKGNLSSDASTEELTFRLSSWVEAFAKGVDAVSEYGGAQRGYRTMVIQFMLLLNDDIPSLVAYLKWNLVIILYIIYQISVILKVCDIKCWA